MKTLKLVFIFLITFLFSCKKTEVSGIVYSRHNIPVSGASVYIEYTRAASKINEPEGTTTKSDNNGKFHLSFKSKNKYTYKVRCICDSGNIWENVKKKESNIIDLMLR